MVTKSKYQLYWDNVHKLAATFPADGVGITSVDDPMLQDWRPGVTVMASPELAVMRITERTHRRATQAEIDAMNADATRRSDECAATEQANRRQSSLHMTAAFVEACKSLGANPGSDKK